MSASYEPVFAWLPTRLLNGSWAWLRTVQRLSANGPYGRFHSYRDYEQ